MPILYNIDILESLKERGINTTIIKKKKIFSDEVVQAFRTGRIVKADNLAKVCSILKCRIEELLAYYPEDTDPKKGPLRCSLFILRSQNKNLSLATQILYFYLADWDFILHGTFDYLEMFYKYIDISIDNMPFDSIKEKVREFEDQFPYKQMSVFDGAYSDVILLFSRLIDKCGNTIYSFLRDFFDNLNNSYLIVKQDDLIEINDIN